MRYTEMNDSGVKWNGEIPKHWKRSKIKYCASFMPPCDMSSLDEESKVTFTPMECVKNGFFENRESTLKSIKGSYTQYQDGDIVFAKVTPCFENGNISIMRNLYSGFGFGSSELFVLRPQNNNTSFLFYSLQSNSFIQAGKASMTGTGGLKRVSSYTVVNYPIFLPPLAEQEAIAAYLNEKCAAIDEIIAQAKVTIEEYKAWKASVIFEAVTKGLDPNAEMKDSGIPWIGKIPKKWKTTTLGAVSHGLRNGYVGPTRDIFIENGIRYIQSLHIKDGAIDFEKHPYYVSEEWGKLHPKIKTNDLLIVQTGDIGQVGLAGREYDGCNCHAVIIVTPIASIINPKYLTCYFRSHPGKELLLSFQTGALLPHLNAGKIKAAPVLLPPIAEQEAIAAYLDKQCAAIDGIIAEKQALIEDLEAYKKSLIYETVTGKRKVS